MNKKKLIAYVTSTHFVSSENYMNPLGVIKLISKGYY